jgi:hypothetical protein
MSRIRPSILVALAVGLAAAPTAQAGVIGTGGGRTGAVVAGLIALVGVVAGVRARFRSGGRDAAIVALVTGLLGAALAVLHLATSSGGIGTGNGRAGAIVAVALGVGAMALGWMALPGRRSER